MRRSHIRKMLAAQAAARAAAKAARHQDNVCRWWSIELQFAFKRTASFPGVVQKPQPDAFRNAREWWASQLLVKGSLSYLWLVEEILLWKAPEPPPLYVTPAVAKLIRRELDAPNKGKQP